MLDPTPSRLRLRRAAPPAARVRLDDTQARVAATPPGSGHLLVVGAPGTGKSTTAVELFLARLAEPDAQPAVLLVPTRRGASRVRDVVAARRASTSADVVVRTPASFAYQVLRARAALLGEPAPTLITGPEQDAVLAELLAGHRDGIGAAIGWPPSIGPDTLARPAFRAELRDLLMRAAELGLGPVELTERGRRHGRPDWVAAARLLAEYEDVTALGALTPDRGARYDVARILDEATSALQRWERDLPGQPRPRWRTVIVDDYQDSTLATARLLRVLADDGAELVLLGDPDAGVQGFRGGAPALVGAAETDAEVGGFGARRVDLLRVWRGDDRLREAARRVSARIGTRAVAAHRAATAAPAADGGLPGGVEVAVLPSGAQEVAFVARRLREEHLHVGTAWDRMAVVARSAAQVGALRRGLAAWGVPVASEVGQGPLRAEPAVRPLLTALRAAVDGLDARDAVDLLCSPLGGMDAVSVRGLRRALRAAGLGEDALCEVLQTPALAAGLPAQHRSGPARVGRVLAAGREAVARPRAGAREVLWELWHATGLAGPWRSRALAGGPAADRADADLDALMALFRAAEQFDERHSGAGPRAFLDHVLGQDLPADTLAARAVRAEAVQVLTPAASSGEEWDVVAVAGLQEDVWPDLRLRDSLLGSRLLVDLEAQRSDGADAARDRAAARREVLGDELRMLLVALTRSRRRLVVTAVLDLDSRPSSFLELLAGPGDAGALVREVPPALDLRGLVAELRAELDRADAAGNGASEPGASEPGAAEPGAAEPGIAERREVAAALLASLARAGVPGADPREWTGLEAPSTEAPLCPDGASVPVSPSSVGSVESCPLRWALESAGGRGEDSLVQSLGTLVHAIAADLPRGTAEEMRAALEERWHTLAVPDGWAGRRTRAEAEAMVERLAAYVADRPGEVEVEVPFRAEVGRALLSGRIDRVERVAGDPDAVRVVDLKTSKSPVSREDGALHPQLATYQVAVEAGALGEGTRSDGARLVYLGTGASGPTERDQCALPDAGEPGWAHDLLARAADAMAGATFAARVGPACTTCPVRTSCPAVPEGRRTTG